MRRPTARGTGSVPFRWLFVLITTALLTVSASGCGALADEPADSGGLVSLHREGGYAGHWDQVTVYDDGTLRTEHQGARGGQGRLTGPELSRLRALLREVGFADLPRRSVSEIGGDRYVYRLTHDGHTITTDQSRKLGAVDEIIDLLSPRLARGR
ncbi:hypothetical protein [Streptomyces buecherae]|uniref:hypothetical protein n=1 Tax=Streptomyces buecherae TaxID=2763006 RepID=UPI001C253A91|nr:hypothetical protein [Streptomyces buecherae]